MSDSNLSGGMELELVNRTWIIIEKESHDRSSSGHTVYTYIDCLFPGGSGVPSNIESGDDGNIKGSWAAKQTICI